MNDPVELLDDELSVLHRGRGLQEPRILERLGPTLRAAFGIRYSDDVAEQRRQLRVGLHAASRSLPVDLRTVFVHALGFDPADPPTVTERLARAAERIDRDPRSARRRLNEARRRVAESLASRVVRATFNNPYVQPGWQVEGLRSLLRLDVPAPRLRESREIIATDEGLGSIVANVSLPLSADGDDAPRLDVVAEEGCSVAASEQVSPSHWRYRLDLPRRLQRGERHHYVVTFVASSLAGMKPYYVLVPFRDFRSFAAEVVFGTPPVASHAWRVDGIPTAVLDDPPSTVPDFDLSETSTVSVEFSRVQQGLCYGLQWTWS